MCPHRIEPKPGYSVAHLKMWGFNIQNAVIKEYGIGGIPTGVEYPYHQENFRRFDPELPPGFDKSEVLDLAGKQIVTAQNIDDDYLYGNWNPYKQLVVFSVMTRDRTLDEILTYIFMEKRPGLPETKNNYNFIKKLVDYLAGQGFINNVGGVYKVGLRKIPVEMHTAIEFQEDKEPIVKEIWDYVRNRGPISYDNIFKFMVSMLGWIQTDEILGNAKDQFEKYITFMKKNRLIKDEGNNIFNVDRRY